MATMNKKLSHHNFALSDQDCVLVGHMSFQVKKIIFSPAKWEQSLFTPLKYDDLCI